MSRIGQDLFGKSCTDWPRASSLLSKKTCLPKKACEFEVREVPVGSPRCLKITHQSAEASDSLAVGERLGLQPNRCFGYSSRDQCPRLFLLPPRTQTMPQRTARDNQGVCLGLLVAVVCLSQAGCYLKPNWGPPGTIGDQRSRAVLFDPYPNNDLGPPVVSGRPLGYERPMPEAEQNQYYPQSSRGAPVQPYTGF